MRMEEIIISEEQEGRRIDKGLFLDENQVSRSRLQKLLKEEMVLVNHKPVKPL